MDNKLDFSQLVGKGLVEALQLREIINARILTKKEKTAIQRGSADINGHSALGNDRLYTRNEIISDFKYLNDKKVAIGGWKSEKTYTVYKPTNTPVLVVKIPSGFSVDVSGKQAGNGVYLVFNITEDGQPDSNNPGIVNSKLFHKMFSIKQSDVITRNRGKGQGTYQINNRQIKRNDTSDIYKAGSQKTSVGNARNIGNMKFDFGADAIANIQPNKTVKSEMNIGKAVVETTKSKSVAIAEGRLFNNRHELVGFLISSPNGQNKRVSNAEMFELCSKKMVGNIELVAASDTGKRHLRGNGIAISQLPEVYI